MVEKYVKKGTQLYVEGKLVTRSWEDQNGGKKYSTDIVAQTLQLLGKKEGGQPQRTPAIAGAQQIQARQSTPMPTVDPSDNPEDDLPF